MTKAFGYIRRKEYLEDTTYIRLFLHKNNSFLSFRDFPRCFINTSNEEKVLKVMIIVGAGRSHKERLLSKHYNDILNEKTRIYRYIKGASSADSMYLSKLIKELIYFSKQNKAKLKIIIQTDTLIEDNLDLLKEFNIIVIGGGDSNFVHNIIREKYEEKCLCTMPLYMLEYTSDIIVNWLYRYLNMCDLYLSLIHI